MPVLFISFDILGKPLTALYERIPSAYVVMQRLLESLFDTRPLFDLGKVGLRPVVKPGDHAIVVKPLSQTILRRRRRGARLG